MRVFFIWFIFQCGNADYNEPRTKALLQPRVQYQLTSPRQSPRTIDAIGQLCPYLLGENIIEKRSCSMKFQNCKGYLDQLVRAGWTDGRYFPLTFPTTGAYSKECSEYLSFPAGNGIPTISTTGLYVSPWPFYRNKFNPEKGYIGAVIYAIKEKTMRLPSGRIQWEKWYSDGRSGHYSLSSVVDGHRFKSHIRPGYIIMGEVDKVSSMPDHIDSNGQSIRNTLHSKLFEYYFGRSVRQFQTDGIEFVAVGFSYDKDLCDYKFRSSTFNAADFLSGSKGLRTDGSAGSVRFIEERLENMITYAINKWRDTGTKLTRMSDYYPNDVIRHGRVGRYNEFPTCN